MSTEVKVEVLWQLGSGSTLEMPPRSSFSRCQRTLGSSNSSSKEKQEKGLWSQITNTHLTSSLPRVSELGVSLLFLIPIHIPGQFWLWINVTQVCGWERLQLTTEVSDSGRDYPGK